MKLTYTTKALKDFLDMYCYKLVQIDTTLNQTANMAPPSPDVLFPETNLNSVGRKI